MADGTGHDGSGNEGAWHGRDGRSMPRHRQAMMSGVPAPYDGLANPLPRTHETLDPGATVYAGNCASCHGSTGRGDGEAGRDLSPPPGNLAWLSQCRWFAGTRSCTGPSPKEVLSSEPPCRHLRTRCPATVSGRSSLTCGKSHDIGIRPSSVPSSEQLFA